MSITVEESREISKSLRKVHPILTKDYYLTISRLDNIKQEQLQGKVIQLDSVPVDPSTRLQNARDFKAAMENIRREASRKKREIQERENFLIQRKNDLKVQLAEYEKQNGKMEGISEEDLESLEHDIDDDTRGFSPAGGFVHPSIDNMNQVEDEINEIMDDEEFGSAGNNSKIHEIKRELEHLTIELEFMPKEISQLEGDIKEQEDLLEDSIIRQLVKSETLDRRRDIHEKNRTLLDSYRTSMEELYEQTDLSLESAISAFLDFRQFTIGYEQQIVIENVVKEGTDQLEQVEREILDPVTEMIVESMKAWKLDSKKIISRLIKECDQEISRDQAMIRKLEKSLSSNVSKHERLYAMSDSHKKLRFFSRTFEGDVADLDSETGEVLRLQKDPAYANRITYMLLGLAIIVNLALTASITIGYVPDLYNWHSFYWMIVMALVFGSQWKIQNIDTVRAAHYYALDPVDREIVWHTGNKWKIKRITVFPLVLYYSPKVLIGDVLEMTPADIASLQDDKTEATARMYQKKASKETYARFEAERDVASKEAMLEDSTRRFSEVKDIVKAELLEEDRRSTSRVRRWDKVIEALIPNVVLLAIVWLVLNAIPPVNLTIGNAQLGPTTAFSFMGGLFVGIFVTTAALRWSRPGM